MGFNPWLSLKMKTIFGDSKGGWWRNTNHTRMGVINANQQNPRCKRGLFLDFKRWLVAEHQPHENGRYKRQPTESSLQMRTIFRFQKVFGGGTPTTREWAL
jgi:hypothetical protein